MFFIGTKLSLIPRINALVGNHFIRYFIQLFFG